MSASARVEMDRLNDVIVVPAAAIFQRSGVPVAFVVDARGIETRPVKVLRRGRDQVALADGIRAGERIALKEPDEANR
jgi:multidrug efflux pump subunit AcrA (membrane-fusion protein)